jgi:sugar phosphate isomerase/epimerase
MNSRRQFLQKAGTLAAGGLVYSKYPRLSFFENRPAGHAVGLQLFTLFNTIDKDVPGTLKEIAGIGYQEIESAFSMKGGFYGLKPKEFEALCKDSGLSWLSHHVSGAPFKMPPGGFRNPGADTSKQPAPPPRRFPPSKNLKENFQEIIDNAAEGGLKYLVCASIPLSTTDEINQAIEILNKSGEAAKKSGIVLCYHNHVHEFEPVDGKLPYDLLLSQTSPDILKFELDLGWATKAGVDPTELFAKNPGRFPLWHVKDITADKKEPTEVGNGIVDFKRIFAKAKIAGMQHFFVEQDGAPKPIENITASFSYIKANLLS